MLCEETRNPWLRSMREKGEERKMADFKVEKGRLREKQSLAMSPSGEVFGVHGPMERVGVGMGS